MDHNAPHTPTAKPESLLRSIGEKTCILSDRLSRRFSKLQASIFSTQLIGSNFDPKLDREKGEDLRRPGAGYRVLSSVHSCIASAHKIENNLNLAAITLLGIIRHNTQALS